MSERPRSIQSEEVHEDWLELKRKIITLELIIQKGDRYDEIPEKVWIDIDLQKGAIKRQMDRLMSNVDSLQNRLI